MRKLMFRLFPMMHGFIYRMSGGRLGSSMMGMDVLLLTTTGRKSGMQRTTPLSYIMDGSGYGYVLTASNGGQERHPAWYHNVTANPTVTIQVGPDQLSAEAEEVGDEKRDELWQRLIETAPAYEGYARRTSRRIPLVIVRPVA